MKLRSFGWLFCATILSSNAAYAEETATQIAPATVEEVVVSTKMRNTLTLDQAIQKAVNNSPRLKSSQASFLATKGERRQASALPNPEIGLEVENFGGKNEMRGFNGTENTLGVNQLVEIGGKRSARLDVADQNLALSRFDKEAVRLDLIRDVELAFADAVAAQEKIKLAEDEKTRASETLKTVKQRVGAAREPLIQQSKAEVTFASSEIGVEQAHRELISAKKSLAALWGGTEEFELDSSDFFVISKPEVLVASSDNLKENPDLARFNNALLKSKAALELEKANAIPDPTISAGIRDFRETGDKAFVMGVSFPIPIFNANGGNIEKARQQVSQTEYEKDASALMLNANLVRAQAELDTSYQQAVALKEKILPAAEKAFRLSREGYGIGKFPYLEVLDAQRTLFETKEQYHNTLKNYHRSYAEVERLTAAHKAQEISQENNNE